MKKGFIKSLPIFCSYLFLGMAYGMLMQEAGFNWKYTWFTCTILFTGAFQYALITFLSTGASLVTVLLTALLMNSRQVFYAISYVDDFKQMKKRKLLSIFWLTDETYAVGNSLERTDDPEKEKDRRETMFWAELFGYFYWMAASTLGGIIGQLIPYDLEGIDFCMTALFVIIFVDQWEKAGELGKETGRKLIAHLPAVAGLVIAIACLLIFGANSFMLPSLMITSAVLLIMNSRDGSLKREEDASC